MTHYRSAPAAIDVLYELRQRRPDLFDKVEIYIDGGIRRGSDVVKSLALGARSVGLGRPFLYANGAYEERGVRKVIQSGLTCLCHYPNLNAAPVLEEEIALNMRLVGARNISELKPEMVTKRDMHTDM